MEKRWGGVFREKTAPSVEQFTESISFDWRLYRQDIAASIAHAQMLGAVGLLSAEEVEKLTKALEDIGLMIDRGELPFRQELEDIHMHVEQALVDRLGELGKKLHTARSRNDQVATDLRLWVREAIDQIDKKIEALQRAFVARCDQDEGVIVPAYTHLRRAQPVLAAHMWLAYCERFGRDRERLADCRRRVNLSPLGAAAIAGTSLPIDRDQTARALGFAGILENSIDASCDRDFIAEFLFCLALTAIHLSGWAEDWILWSSTEFGFLSLPDAYCTGSSIMPQKRNPDVLELVRGKCARVIGDLQTILVLLKGLPLGYNRDLQEDKVPLFDAFDTVSACLEIAAEVVSAARLDRNILQQAVEVGFLDATTLMEFLIRRGIPQRDAHHVVGRLVRRAIESGRRLAEISLEEFRQEIGDVGPEVFSCLGARNAVQAMQSAGSTHPEQVALQVRRWKERLGIK
ncbi:MAG: argininosuccinate lyase [Thermoguttaceae bacterium]|nr:argininosuccinate lyase [Thermoguttaceae bacterium]MDW8078203.1 argininosuccinate lyase [Thermoguttaceae bacterium]